MQILTGDALSSLRTLDAESVQCVVTSPPYFRLRDYNIDGQIGLENTPAEYVATLVEIFREIKRVLRKDATVWLNLGDTYSYSGRGGGGSKQPTNKGSHIPPLKTPDIAPKNLLGIPWRVAFALQDDGWILRSAIIWHKPNPMPESVKDRPTNSYEHVFLLSKKPSYFYDADAVREDPSGRTDVTTFGKVPDRKDSDHGYQKDGLKGANARNVWRIQPKPFKGAHFATMPVELAERCIDPFGGAGTTGLAAKNLDRDFILIELNPDYVRIAEERLGLSEIVLP